MTRRAAVALAALGCALLTAGCVSPSRTDDDYRRKAANTAQAVASSVSTVFAGAEAARDGKVFGPYLSRLVAEAEDDALSAQQSFDSVQPPSGRSDDLHDHLDQLLQDALDVLREARLAARRGDLARVAQLRDALSKSADDLDAFEEHPR